MFERRERNQRSNPVSEAELVRALAEGSDSAMAALYQLHGGLIYRFCLRMVQNESIAEEVTHVFLPRQRKHWKESTAKTTTDEIERYLLEFPLDFPLGPRQEPHRMLSRQKATGRPSPSTLGGTLTPSFA
jgi:hypothetical protein